MKASQAFLFIVIGYCGYSVESFQHQRLNCLWCRHRIQIRLSSRNEVEAEEQRWIDKINKDMALAGGGTLDQLMNPNKVIKLQREIDDLRATLRNRELSPPARSDANTELDRKLAAMQAEQKMVMGNWLKTTFVVQALLAGAVSLALVYDAVPGYDAPLAARALGFWSWWLFIIPSLRARKPSHREKKALNAAFLASPLVSILLPALLTRDVAVIWWANAGVVALAYAYGYSTAGDDAAGAGDASSPFSRWVSSALRALDYGSGRERGARK